jgi:vacuolar-type H+-ATPase subunit E/Vma4
MKELDQKIDDLLCQSEALTETIEKINNKMHNLILKASTEAREWFDEEAGRRPIKATEKRIEQQLNHMRDIANLNRRLESLTSIYETIEEELTQTAEKVFQ